MTASRFERDRLTWLMYVMLAGLAYQQGVLGPLMPFLRASLDLSYTRGGVLVTAISLGMVLSGLISDRVARRVGRRRMFWAGAVGYVIGSWGLALSPSFAFAFAAVLFNSIASAFTITAINASLADRHGLLRTRALAEANVAAALSASVSPIVIGMFQSAGLGWQWALYLTLGIVVVIALMYGSVAIPDRPATAGSVEPTDAALPPGFWLYWLVVICVVAFEWCFVVWGADYLVATVGFEPALASTTMGVFLGAMVLGRVIGSVVDRWWAAATVLPVAMVIALLGFPIFWLGQSPAMVVAGLFICGLGVSSLFPLTLSIAVGQAAGRTNAATARVSLAVGVAIFSAPLLLGGLADRLSLQAAFAVAPILGVTTLVLLGFAYRHGWR